jgi:hypothetical protein
MDSQENSEMGFNYCRESKKKAVWPNYGLWWVEGLGVSA